MGLRQVLRREPGVPDSQGLSFFVLLCLCLPAYLDGNVGTLESKVVEFLSYKPLMARERDFQKIVSKVDCNCMASLIGDINYQEFAKRLWGDIYFNPKT